MALPSLKPYRDRETKKGEEGEGEEHIELKEAKANSFETRATYKAPRWRRQKIEEDREMTESFEKSSSLETFLSMITKKKIIKALIHTTTIFLLHWRLPLKKIAWTKIDGPFFSNPVDRTANDSKVSTTNFRVVDSNSSYFNSIIQTHRDWSSQKIDYQFQIKFSSHTQFFVTLQLSRATCFISLTLLPHVVAEIGRHSMHLQEKAREEKIMGQKIKETKGKVEMCIRVFVGQTPSACVHGILDAPPHAIYRRMADFFRGFFLFLLKNLFFVHFLLAMGFVCSWDYLINFVLIFLLSCRWQWQRAITSLGVDSTFSGDVYNTWILLKRFILWRNSKAACLTSGN